MQEPRVQDGSEHDIESANVDRRAFLNNYGKLALVAPPVLTTLLSTSMSSPAIAQTTGGPGGPGGNGGDGDDSEILFAGAGLPLLALAGDKEEAIAAPIQEVLPESTPAPPPPQVIPPPPPPPEITPERG